MFEQYIAEQKEYCKSHNVPCFMPADAKCFNCGWHVFINEREQKAASIAHITGCPICSYSFTE